MAKLSVNVNAIAYLRNRRELPWPSLEGLGRIALEAGAAGLTVHPRPDERHVRRTDVPVLAELVRSFPGREFNIEGNPDARFVQIVEAAKPDQVTLVPDDVRQSTSDHGWDIPAHAAFLSEIIPHLKQSGMRVSLFVDAMPERASEAKEVGADRIEIFTGPYGATLDQVGQAIELKNIVATAEAARKAGIGVNAGHDLTLKNLPPLIAHAPNILEVSIGHALTADALAYGMAETVRLYRTACGDAAKV